MQIRRPRTALRSARTLHQYLGGWYRNPEARLDALLKQVNAAGIRLVASAGRLKRSMLPAFVKEGATRHRSAIEKVEATVCRIAASRSSINAPLYEHRVPPHSLETVHPRT